MKSGNGSPDPDSDRIPGSSYLPPAISNGNGNENGIIISPLYGVPNGNVIGVENGK